MIRLADGHYLCDLVNAGRLYVMAEALLIPAPKIVALDHFVAAVNDLLEHCSEIVATGELVNLIQDDYEPLLGTDLAIEEPICRLIGA